MLRALLALTLILNALFFGWSRGWLDSVIGIKAQGDREPERVAARQVHPERVQLLGDKAAAELKKTACVELGPFDGDSTLAAAQSTLERGGVAAANWELHSTEVPGVWAVATIRLGTKDFQARKEETYKKLKISYDFLPGPPEEQPTLVLARFPSEKAASAALDAYTKRALQGLRVMQLQAAGKQHTLQFKRADGALQARLRGLGNAAALAGGPKACAAPLPAEAASAPASAASH